MNRPLLISSAFLAVFWTAFMYFWRHPEGYSGGIALVVGGPFLGVIWYLAMNWFTRRMTS